ncbi:hypothetical protein Sspor_71410 [Streptomyces spororaveus]|uniref:Uncharacterized protein n=1 Tax=Streptomyces spororaveus TaxID=284039 RepID=A0ABQ3TMD6_9ACTN|nr:hypothetical protein Sspor_71410 [Streptomyces spororaveus]
MAPVTRHSVPGAGTESGGGAESGAGAEGPCASVMELLRSGVAGAPPDFFRGQRPAGCTDRRPRTDRVERAYFGMRTVSTMWTVALAVGMSPQTTLEELFTT